MKVHCADNIVQQTCKSWQDVTFKLQKALCRWEHAKSTFYLTTVTTSNNGHQFKSLHKKEPLNPSKKMKKKIGTTHKIENISVLSHLPALNRLFTFCLSRSIL